MVDTRIAQVARENARLLYRVAYGIVRNGSVAEEVCQDVMLKLVRSPAQVRDWSAVRAWLVRATTNSALQHLRRSKTEKRVIERTPRRTADGNQPDFLLRDKLLARLETLEPELRDVVVLRVMQGYSGVETQHALGLTAVEVSRRLHAGLARLRAVVRDNAALA